MRAIDWYHETQQIEDDDKRFEAVLNKELDDNTHINDLILGSLFVRLTRPDYPDKCQLGMGLYELIMIPRHHWNFPEKIRNDPRYKRLKDVSVGSKIYEMLSEYREKMKELYYDTHPAEVVDVLITDSTTEAKIVSIQKKIRKELVPLMFTGMLI